VTTGALPLEGLRVIDLTSMLAGPFASMILADLGADVIKVESPEGDFTRHQGPYTDDDTIRAYGGYFQSINRNKRGIVLDLRTKSDSDQLRELVRSADVLLENFRDGVMERLGLSYESLAEINPRLVYGAIRGFGDHRTGASPLLDWPAYDLNVQALSGIMTVTGEPAGPPTKVGPGVGDTVPGLFAVAGVLAAIFQAQRSGRGTFVDVAMYDAMVALCERQIYQHSYTGAVPGRHGSSHPFLSPFEVLECADGWVTVAAPADKHWNVLCGLIDRPDLVSDSRTSSASARAHNSQFVHDVLSQWARPQTRAEITALLGGTVPVGPVNDVSDLFDDQHLTARRMLAPIEQPGEARSVVVAGRPIKFLGVEEPNLRRAPLLGEHTAEVLAEINRGESESPAAQNDLEQADNKKGLT